MAAKNTLNGHAAKLMSSMKVWIRITSSPTPKQVLTSLTRILPLPAKKKSLPFQHGHLRRFGAFMCLCERYLTCWRSDPMRMLSLWATKKPLKDPSQKVIAAGWKKCWPKSEQTLILAVYTSSVSYPRINIMRSCKFPKFMFT